MKRTSKILSAAIALAMSFGVFSFGGFTKAGAEGEMVTPKLSMYLNIGENIAFNTLATLPENATGVSATYAWNDGKTDYEKTIDENSEEFSKNGNEYTFTYRGITPEYMASKVNVTVNYDGTSLRGSQSIKGYLEGLIAEKPATVGDYSYEKLKTLAYDMLDYGASAQAYRGEANYVNGKIEKGNSFFESDITSNYTATTANVKWGAGARYDYSVKPVVRFTLKEGVTASDLTAKVTFNGQTNDAEVEEKDGAYLVAVEGFSLMNVDDAFTVTVYNGGEELDSVTTNYATIAKKASNNKGVKPGSVPSTTSKDVKLIFDTYVYAKSAIDYKNVVAAGEKAYTFEAEEAIISDSNNRYKIASNGVNGEKYISDFNYAATGAYVSFKVNAENDCEAKLVISTNRYAGYNRLFNNVFQLAVNDEAVSVDSTLGVGEYEGDSAKKWITFFDTEITTISLKKGVNYVKFTKGSNTLNFDAIRLVSDTVLYKDTYTFEAEAAVGAETLKKETYGTASGGEYLANLSSCSATLTFYVVSDEDAYSTLYFRTNGHYAHEYDLSSKYKVTVNGTAVSAESGAKLVKNMLNKDDNCWKAFHDTKACAMPIKKGVNVITVSNINAFVNFDAIRIVSSATLSDMETEAEMKIEAEDCTLGGNAKVSSEENSNNPSGGKYVGGFSLSDTATISFTVVAENDCTATFVTCYGNRTTDTTDGKFASKFVLTVNDAQLTSEVVFKNGTDNDYFGWEEYAICTVTLKAGENVFTLQGTGATSSNIDYFRLIADGEYLGK